MTPWLNKTPLRTKNVFKELNKLCDHSVKNNLTLSIYFLKIFVGLKKLKKKFLLLKYFF